MKIMSANWFTQMANSNVIGIVMGEVEFGERKAYIGTSEGLDEEEDAEHIAKTGAKISAVTLRSMAEFLDNQD